MRFLPAIALVVFAASAAEPAQTYPQWDGKETVAEYAKRAGSPSLSSLQWRVRGASAILHRP
jgi:hypothetical protein